MRFAGEAIQKYTGDSAVSEHGDVWQKNYQMMQQRPVVPGFNTEDLKVTPELQMEGYQGPGADLVKDKYIRYSPASGVS